jgi:predicted membrane protein
LIAQRDDQIDRNALTGRRERTWAKFTGVILGYGYQPSRALWCLAAVLVAIVAISLALGDRGGLARVDPVATAPESCTTVEQIGVGLELGLPLISIGAQDRCAPTNTYAGDALTLIGWVAQLLAWGFATLFVAGFTGAVRKS